MPRKALILTIVLYLALGFAFAFHPRTSIQVSVFVIVSLLVSAVYQIEGFYEWQKAKLERMDDKIEGQIRSVREDLEALKVSQDGRAYDLKEETGSHLSEIWLELKKIRHRE